MSSSNAECLHSVFEARAAATPDAPAVTFSGETLSYDGLNRRANRLACHLRSLGVARGQLVGLSLDRSLDTVVAILAVLKAGGAYVPMDPMFPPERVRMIVEDAACPVILLHEAQRERFAAFGQVELAVLDGAERPWDACGDDNPSAAVTGADLAYVIYTSGSTGVPKGTLITHRHVIRLCAVTEPWFGFGAQDVWALFHSYAFDVSVWEFWGAFFCGGRLVVVPRLVSQSPELFFDLLVTEKVSVLCQTPSAFRQLQFYDESLPRDRSRALALRYVILAGEAVDFPSLRGWFEVHGDERPRLINMYGPTEATVYVTYRPISTADTAPGTPSYIGVPLPDIALHVLDEKGEPVAEGEKGELFIGGEGVALGYLRRPELTAERFVPDPFAPQGARGIMYKTGDIVRRSKGDLEFLGRNDFQVQIRGYRVELGEVESVLNRHGAVRGAVVRMREDVPGDPRLVAYYLAQSPQPNTALRSHVSAALPDYMVPSLFVHMTSFPLNTSGKIDLAALPVPEYARGGAAIVAPRNGRERAIARLWEEVLSVPQVGVTDNFFDLGGHSLLAIRLIVRMEQQFSVRLPLKAFLDGPTVADQAEAIDRAMEEAGQSSAPAPLPAPGTGGRIPLSFPQEQLWVIARLEPDIIAYNIPLVLAFDGPFDVPRMETALNGVIATRDALRTVFREEDGVPYQHILDQLAVPLAVEEIAGGTDSERRQAVGRRATSLAGQPMDLGEGPLIRACAFTADGETRDLVVVVHHINFDGWSISLFLQDLAAAYNRDGDDNPLRTESCTYAQFARWQRAQFGTPHLEQQRDFWRRKLGGTLPVLEVPLDKPRPPHQTYVGDVLRRTLPDGLADRLNAAATGHRVTPFVMFLAGWQALLYRYTGQGDSIVGVALAGRGRVEFEEVIGFFINTVAVRVPIARDLPFCTLLERVNGAAREAHENQDVPFKQVVADCQRRRDPSRPPIFQHMFVFHNTPRYTAEFSGLHVHGEEGINGGAKFDLTMAVQPLEHGYALSLEYNAALYEAATAEKILDRYIALLVSAAAAPARAVGQLALSDTSSDRAPVAIPEPKATQPAGGEGCLHALFEKRAARTPDAPAVTCEGTTLSYGELNARANQVAHYLAGHGVGPGTLVGLCLDRSIDTVVSILGVLKSGAAYVPMDPLYPAERMRIILEDAACPVVITQQAQRNRFRDDGGATILVLDSVDSDLGGYPAGNPCPLIGADDLAYVIYTSGSTGKPKGALIYHRNVTRLFTGMEHWFTFSESDSWSMFHSYAFDFSVWEMWGALLYGGRLVVVPYVVSRSPEYFYNLLVDEGITVLSQTPSAFRQLQYFEEQRPLSAAKDLALRIVVVGGETVDLPSFAPWFERHGDKTPQMNIVYGITETTVFVTCRPIGMEDTKPGTPSYIGTAIPDLTLHVLDEDMKEVAVGEVGELYVGGAGVGGGYLRRPELNRERFLPDPFGGEAGATLYKTGDLVRLFENDLEFIGRNDHQVQVRGFRVELGEIEAVMTGHPLVRETIVRAREDRPGDMRLVAYYLAREEVPASSLRACIAEKLPEYMVPSTFIRLEAFPLNNNGKVAVDALPAPALAAVGAGADEMPATPTELAVSEVWCPLLRVERAGMDDNFFELGGHSLLAIQALTQLNGRLGLKLGLRDFFAAPTIRALAAEIDRLSGGGARPELKQLVALREGWGVPFFCVKGAGDVGGSYETLAAALSETQPFYGFPDLDFDDLEAAGESVGVEAIARRCIEEIVKVRPHGPYYIGGYSFGGIVAYEIAQQLIAAGEEVPFIAMLDSTIPDHEEVPKAFSPQYVRHLINRIRVRLVMLASTWKLMVGYGRDAVRVAARRLLRGDAQRAVRPGLYDYLRWIQLDTSVQYFLIQAGLVKPSIAERRLEMVEEHVVRQSTRSMVASKQSMASYKLRPIPARITLFRAADNPWRAERRDPTFGWSRFAEKGVEVVVVPGNHMVLIRWPFATDLGKALQKAIDAVRKGADTR